MESGALETHSINDRERVAEMKEYLIKGTYPKKINLKF